LHRGNFHGTDEPVATIMGDVGCSNVVPETAYLDEDGR
jgi:hypothetical protein